MKGMALRKSNLKVEFVLSGLPENRYVYCVSVKEDESKDDLDDNEENDEADEFQGDENKDEIFDIEGREGKFKASVTVIDRYVVRWSKLGKWWNIKT